MENLFNHSCKDGLRVYGHICIQVIGRDRLSGMLNDTLNVLSH